MEPSTDSAARSCYRCGTPAGADDLRCGRCGGTQLKSSAQVRTLGWVLIGCGVFLLLLMGSVTFFVTQLIFESGKPGATTRFTGDRGMLIFMYGLFGLVLAFGGASLWAGIYQVRTGLRNRQMTTIVLVLAGLLYVSALAVRWLD